MRQRVELTMKVVMDATLPAQVTNEGSKPIVPNQTAIWEFFCLHMLFLSEKLGFGTLKERELCGP